VISHLLNFVTDPKDVARLSMVSKQWNKNATSNTLWRKLYNETFTDESTPEQKSVIENWKIHFNDQATKYKTSPFILSTVR
jgi:hypothetical protein